MDEERRKSAGWTLLDALTELQDESGQHHVRSLAAVTSGQVTNVHEIKNRQAAAWLALRERLVAEELVAYGIRSPQRGVERIESFFAAAAEPSFTYGSLGMAGKSYSGVRLYRSGEGPPGLRGASQEIKQPRQLDMGSIPEAHPIKNPGGVKAQYDWDEFLRELIRALFAGDLVDRQHIRAHMKRWCEKWEKQPDESTIRKKLDPLLHISIPEKASKAIPEKPPKANK